MNYAEAIAYIHSTYQFGSKLGLDNISHLLSLMGDPHERVKYIHVAGTNGKGSTSSMIHSILRAQGYRVGLYTSPYLEVFNERIRLDGENIPDQDLADITAFVKAHVDQMLSEGYAHPTEFEIVTAVAFEYYARSAVDFVVLEVGMGGRLDSTNVISRPLVSVITPIDLDHVEYLGDTLAKVAFEKAGIIKPHTVCVTHPQSIEAQEVIERVCSERGTRLIVAPVAQADIQSRDLSGTTFELFGRRFALGLLGDHQVRNAVVAITAARALSEACQVRIDEASIQKGLQEAKWPGRLEVMSLSPIVMIDGAHNLHGAKGLASAVRKLMEGRRITGVVGILGDKDVSGMLAEMMPLLDAVVVTEPDNPRKMKAEMLAEQIRPYGLEPEIREKIADAMEKAFHVSGPDDVILFFGSLYMIGEARTLLKEKLADKKFTNE